MPAKPVSPTSGDYFSSLCNSLYDTSSRLLEAIKNIAGQILQMLTFFWETVILQKKGSVKGLFLTFTFFQTAALFFEGTARKCERLWLYGSNLYHRVSAAAKDENYQQQLADLTKRLDALNQIVPKLEAEVKRLSAENTQIRGERKDLYARLEALSKETVELQLSALEQRQNSELLDALRYLESVYENNERMTDPFREFIEQYRAQTEEYIAMIDRQMALMRPTDPLRIPWARMKERVEGQLTRFTLLVEVQRVLLQSEV